MATSRNHHIAGYHSQSYSTMSFGDAMLAQMYSFYQEEVFCDFKIKVQDKIYQVHRLVLASCSDYFRAMLTHDMKETREECTNLKGLTVNGVELLIKYAYTGELELTMDNIHEVIAGSTFLQMSKAIELCVDYLKQNMTFQNADELLMLGEMFNVSSLRKYYRAYLLKNFLEFVESDSFLNIDADSLADYLSDDSLNTTSEAILFHHCMRWYQHDPENREEVAHKVFEKIRICNGQSALIQFVSEQELFKKNEKCKEILEFSDRYWNDRSKRYINNTTYRTRVRSNRYTIIQIGGVMEMNIDYDSYVEMMDFPTGEPVGWTMSHYFHPDLKSWFPLGNYGHMDKHVSHQRFVEINGCGVMLGGYEYHTSGDIVSKITLRDVKMFSAQGTFDVCDMPSLQHERARHAAIYLDGFIYAFGGKDDNQGLKSVEKFDCHQEIWSYAKPMPLCLYDHAASTCQGKIFVSGGAESRIVKKYLWCYDPEINNWCKKKDLNCARAGHGMVNLNDHLYVAGGYNGSIESQLRCLVSVEQYSVDTNQWTKLNAMKLGVAFFEMTVLDGNIIVMGGVDSAGRITQYMHEYNHNEGTWKVFGELPRPLKNACCGAVVIKLTDTGCMEDESDEIEDKYWKLFYESAVQEEFELGVRMMENFDPGDYLLDDEDFDSEEEEYLQGYLF
ncbi:Kelch-like protein 6 [Mactra antiquata]